MYLRVYRTWRYAGLIYALIYGIINDFFDVKIYTSLVQKRLIWQKIWFSFLKLLNFVISGMVTEFDNKDFFSYFKGALLQKNCKKAFVFMLYFNFKLHLGVHAVK